MEQEGYYGNVRILEEKKPAESPAEQEEENLFGWADRNIFEQDDAPASSPQSSLYGMSQLICDVNAPTQEDPEDVALCSLATEADFQSASLDWNNEVEREVTFGRSVSRR